MELQDKRLELEERTPAAPDPRGMQEISGMKCFCCCFFLKPITFSKKKGKLSSGVSLELLLRAGTVSNQLSCEQNKQLRIVN